MYLEFDHYFWTPGKYLVGGKIIAGVWLRSVPHMYKVAYVLPLISELFIRGCGCVCVY